MIFFKQLVSYTIKQEQGGRNMNTKKLLFILLVTGLCVSFVANSAWAGPKQRYRWEGVAIGVGAVILGNALLNSCVYTQPRPAPVYCKPRIHHGPVFQYYISSFDCRCKHRKAHHQYRCKKYKPHHPRRHRYW